MTADLKSSLDVYRRRIDLRLGALLPDVLPGQSALGDALHDSVLAPGKRLRPLMTLIAAEDLGGATAAAIDAGCAVEMIHAASLVLDDLPCMDNATLRRGLPAVHIGHGEDVAVLVSVAALSRAYQVLAQIEGLAAEARIECVAVLSGAVGVAGLVGGQFEDLRGGRMLRPMAEIAAANGLKTGSLFSASVEIGGVVAGAQAATRVRLRRFADELGHAFQLLDDLLDGAKSPVAIGKDIGQDVGKSTIVSLIGRTSARRRIERHIEAAHESLTDIFGARSRLHGLIEIIFDQAMRATVEDDSGQDKALPLGQEIGAR
ncbi:MAG: polyprenyl synthetase family protein [Rhizobiaceae bacterium]|nr:polyprenyl synthetase family protein [Rhizobiaceae bacterium]